MTLDEFTTECFERLRADMRSIRDPEGDVHPALFHTFDGELIQRMKIPKSWFDSRATKDAMAKAIARATIIARPLMIGWTTTTYIVEVRQDALGEFREQRKTTAIADMPGRREVLVLLTLDRASYRYAEADITRDGRNPPSYAEWKNYGDEVTDLRGYVLEPIMASMR